MEGSSTVHTGIEVLREGSFGALAGQRVGLLTNPSAVDRQFISTYDILSQAANVDLVALYGPEHGFAAAAPDAAAVESTRDGKTGLPVYSLYGQTLRPTRDMLHDVDVLVCDIQDIGARFYTYLWTLSYILEACGEYGVDVVILDRPNPLGDTVAGPPLEPNFTSFVGRYNLPIQHGMTLGELAQMINGEWNRYPANLRVIQCEGWVRQMTWDATGLPFVTTSPAIPHASTVMQYPGACLIEGTTLSEGRGTALPFEVVGAPYIDGARLAEVLNEQQHPGVRFRPHAFLPTSSKFAGTTCYGVQAHITDTARFLPIETWLAVIIAVRRLYPDGFNWLPLSQEQYERGDVLHFDRLIGSDTPRLMIEDGASLDEITAGWSDFCAEFQAERQIYLLYD
ncbi:DUF1343 domain-containing protein [Phototrophicus methaneseepsis]|uniref:DUF1343 domain-containing protein n=1 Tax=Phototrophicus methaneseepsis TaxID=2710758 RepID=A0A7S8IG22_9CHLR|nr:DUF1343 domain-containing protein [Phototrophicus methaneseepsis]QPC84089.1 DUF1343 domain-containing protein [Phototrophicus methaneseepsis]